MFVLYEASFGWDGSSFEEWLISEGTRPIFAAAKRADGGDVEDEQGDAEEDDGTKVGGERGDVAVDGDKDVVVVVEDIGDEDGIGTDGDTDLSGLFVEQQAIVSDSCICEDSSI